MLGAIEASSQPVLVTHANARALADLERNKTDDIIKAVAQRGGVIGASIYGPMCWDRNPARKPTIDDYICHLEYIVNIAGFEHIAFGTDLATGANYQRMALEQVRLKFTMCPKIPRLLGLWPCFCMLFFMLVLCVGA
jgi:microsomal dipeptidase-like Zn-dependent dipeptidase